MVTHPITGSKHKTTSDPKASLDCQGLGVSRSPARNSQWCSQWYLLNVRVELPLVSPRGGGITEKCTLHQFCVRHTAWGAGFGQGQAAHAANTSQGAGCQVVGAQSLNSVFPHLLIINFSKVKHQTH